MLRIVSIVLWLVGMLAGSASAECAWVLWFTSGNAGRPNASPNQAFSDREQCIQVAKEWTETIIKPYKARYPDDVAYLTCLPDTVDPRGPKVK